MIYFFQAVAQIEKRTITLAINDSTIVVHSKSNSEIVVNIVFTTPDLPKKIQSLDGKSSYLLSPVFNDNFLKRMKT